MADRLYVSNKNETVRMFESDFMEFFSRVHPVTPLVLFVPVVGYMLYTSVWLRQLSIVAVTALFLLGVLLWTLIEYLIHRYVFHYEPKTRCGKQLHFVIHGVHHDYPNDARRLVMPPVISVPLVFLFFGLFFLIFGSLAPAVFVGLVFGVLCYDMRHYATDPRAMNSGVWLRLKQYHLRHHFQHLPV